MRDFLTMFWKELLQVSNRRRFATQKTVIAALVAAIFTLMAYGVVYEGSRATFEQMASFGRSFFYTMVGVMAPLLSLAALVFASGIVVAERVRQRLALLLVTPLGGTAIVGSKAASVFSRVMGAMLIALPAVALLQVFGGINRESVLTGVVFVVSNVWLYGLIGLLCSVVGRSATGAIARAAVVALAWNLVPLFYLMYITATVRMGAGLGPGPWTGLSPFDLSGFFEYFMMVWTPPQFSVWEHVACHAIVNGIAGGLCLVVALAAFRTTSRRLVSGAPDKRVSRRLRRAQRAQAAAEARFKAEDAAADASGRPRPDRALPPSALLRISTWFDDCVIGKELAHWRPWRTTLPLAWFVVVWVVVLLFSAAVGEMPNPADTSFEWPMFLVEAVGFLFLLSLAASTRIAREREGRTLQALAITSLGAWRIVRGKAVSLLIEQSLPLLVLYAHLVFIMWLDFPSPAAAAARLGGLAVSAVLCTALGLYFSISAKTAAHAVIMTALTWFLGIYAVGVPVMWLLALLSSGRVDGLGSAASNSTVGIVLALAALFAIFVTLRAARRRGHGMALAFLAYATLAGAATMFITDAAGVGRGDAAALMMVFLPAASIFPGGQRRTGDGDAGPAGAAGGPRVDDGGDAHDVRGTGEARDRVRGLAKGAAAPPAATRRCVPR